VVTGHDHRAGLEEADFALGLRGGRQLLFAPAAEVTSGALEARYK
jgi:hypothetical protein